MEEEELNCSTKNAPCMLICTLYEKSTIHVANSILSLNNECQFNPVVLQLDKAIVFRSTRSIPLFCTVVEVFWFIFLEVVGILRRRGRLIAWSR